MGWGLGYMGQPHIPARFMAIDDPDKLPAARRMAMGWMVTVLCGSVLTGLSGMACFFDTPLANNFTVRPPIPSPENFARVISSRLTTSPGVESRPPCKVLIPY